MTQKYVTTANTGHTVTKYHTREDCSTLYDSDYREISDKQVELRGLDECGQCKRMGTEGYSEDQDWEPYRTCSNYEPECRDCGKALGAGYLCDDCDTVDGWPE